MELRLRVISYKAAVGAGQYMDNMLMVSNTILQIRPYGEVQGLAHSFAVVVRALAAASSKTHIRSLSAHSWDGVKHTTIRNMSSKGLSSMVSSSAVYMALGRAFQKLRSVSLLVMFWEHDYTGDSTPRSRIWLADFLGYAYILEQLSLTSNGWTWRSSKHGGESAFRTFVKVLSPGSLCHLKCLELCHIEFTKDELLAMISKFSNSLTDLTLTDVKFRSGQWATFLPTLQDLDNGQPRYNLDLSWLLETNTVNPGQGLDFVVFDEDGIDKCSHFWHFGMLRTKACKHVSYLTKDKNQDLLQ